MSMFTSYRPDSRSWWWSWLHWAVMILLCIFWHCRLCRLGLLCSKKTHPCWFTYLRNWTNSPKPTTNQNYHQNNHPINRQRTSQNSILEQSSAYNICCNTVNHCRPLCTLHYNSFRTWAAFRCMFCCTYVAVLDSPVAVTGQSLGSCGRWSVIAIQC